MFITHFTCDGGARVAELISAPALSNEQLAARDALRTFIDGSAASFFIGGAAGTGKTHLMAAVAAEIPEVLLAAPTNLVAARLRSLTGLGATTLHRLMYRPREVWTTTGGVKTRRLCWQRVADSGALAGRIVVVDEAGAAPAWIVRDLLDLGVRVVGFGDPHQLAPVDGAQFFVRPDFELRQVHRQAGDSAIIRQAHRILRGGTYQADGADFQVVQSCAAYLDWPDVIICHRNATRISIIDRMRAASGITPGTPPRRGEPLTCVATNHRAGFLNGERFVVLEDFRPGGPLLLRGPLGVVQADNPHVETVSDGTPSRQHTAFAFGYAITAHRAQGSEWRQVLVIDEAFGPDAKAWRYTAITRARDAVRIGRRL